MNLQSKVGSAIWLASVGPNAMAGPSRGSPKIVYCDEAHVVPIAVSGEGTVLSFPTRPSKVVMGKQQSFALEYMENDVAVAPLSLPATSNLFVYVMGKRYAFALRGGANGESVVLIRDEAERPARPRPK